MPQPPFFPHINPITAVVSEEGGTIWDFYAAAALNGILAACPPLAGENVSTEVADRVAASCKAYADALMTLRPT